MSYYKAMAEPDREFLMVIEESNCTNLSKWLNHPKVAGSLSFRICMGFNLSYKKKKKKKKSHVEVETMTQTMDIRSNGLDGKKHWPIRV